MEIVDVSGDPTAAERAFRHPVFVDFLKQNRFELAGCTEARFDSDEERNDAMAIYNEDPKILHQEFDHTTEIFAHPQGLAWARSDSFVGTPILSFLTSFTNGAFVETVNRRTRPPRLVQAHRLPFFFFPQPLWTSFHAPGWDYHLQLLGPTQDPDLLWQAHLKKVRALETQGYTLDTRRVMARYMVLRRQRSQISEGFLYGSLLAGGVLAGFVCINTVSLAFAALGDPILLLWLVPLWAAWPALRSLIVPILGRLPLRKRLVND